MSEHVTIESMPLYTNLDRIAKSLAALGIGPTDPIRSEQLFPLDQWHIHGIDAVRRAAEQFGLGPASRVLDIGSGLGGPARFLAHSTGCHVTALELQPSLHAIAADLTQRCGLGKLVTHLCGDALSHPIPDAAFDVVVSWLAVHHITDRTRLLARFARALRPGGGCYIEDLCMHVPFSEHNLHEVRDILAAPVVTTIDDFVSDLREAGFISVMATDLTADVTPIVVGRLAAWRKGHTTYADEYGEDAYTALETFYEVIARLFENGSLGIARLVACVP